MCGIVGYIGQRSALEVVIESLKTLEYRGYDSAGVSVLVPQDSSYKLKVYKKAGRIHELEEMIKSSQEYSDLRKTNIGIGHTRWATHGKVSDENAHPHIDCNNQISIVHNGIIENFSTLKEKLISKGHIFRTETDSEVIAHLIEEFYKEEGSLIGAVRKAVEHLIGAFGVVVLSSLEPDKLIAIRRGSPLVLGIGNNEMIVASDANALIAYTKNVVYLDDGEIAIITQNSYSTEDFKGNIKNKDIYIIDWEKETLEKKGYPHFMLKEIFEQPETVENAMKGRVLVEEGMVKLGGIKYTEEELRDIKRVVIIGCGTAWHAGLVGEYMLEEFARIPVEVEYASEFRYRNPILDPNTLVIAISQSGETADTLEGVREAKRKGAKLMGIINVVGSSIARETGQGIYIHAGPEIGVASTKAFTGQLTALFLFSILMGRLRNLGIIQARELLKELQKIPEKIKRILENAEKIKEIALKYRNSQNFLYLGRGYHYPIALEGALKLKEISYIHAEGYPAAEMKHGPIALIDEHMPVVVIATKHPIYDKVLNNILEIKARRGKVIAITNEGDDTIKSIADEVIEIPFAPEPLSPILAVIPLQLMAYYIAASKGLDVDKPRNLAKSVTVE